MTGKVDNSPYTKIFALKVDKTCQRGLKTTLSPACLHNTSPWRTQQSAIPLIQCNHVKNKENVFF